MTPREVFDKVKAHLLAQGAPALNPRAAENADDCLYRAPDGKKCAVGCLITDEAYKPDLEGRAAITYSPVFGALAQSGVPVTEKTPSGESVLWMLRDLQSLHDHQPASTWAADLDRLEQRFFGGAHG